MKTAIQELIKGLKDAKEICEAFGASKIELTIFNSCISSASDLLEKEKQQIMEAFKDGISTNINEETPEEYYNKYFGN